MICLLHFLTHPSDTHNFWQDRQWYSWILFVVTYCLQRKDKRSKERKKKNHTKIANMHSCRALPPAVSLQCFVTLRPACQKGSDIKKSGRRKKKTKKVGLSLKVWYAMSLRSPVTLRYWPRLTLELRSCVTESGASQHGRLVRHATENRGITRIWLQGRILRFEFTTPLSFAPRRSLDVKLDKSQGDFFLPPSI